MTRSLIVFATTVFAVTSLWAQSPTPVIVQAIPVTSAPVAAAPVAAAVPTMPVESSPAALRVLQEIKAANDVILTKQAATLTQLDEMEKAAEQLKIYSKRG